ncbi:MAG: HAMP domain-containing protein [Deltaproteobacteria bacterium]|nr:HAMP domain-containing protein [Deltaproteobacteria bacterium]
MRISTRLKIAASIPAVMLLIIGSGLLLSYRSFRILQEQEAAAYQISAAFEDLSDFARSYVLHHGERPRQQFLLKHGETQGLIARAQSEIPAYRHVLTSIAESNALLHTVFLKLISNQERHGGLEGDHLLKEGQERLQAQLLIRGRNAKAEALGLVTLLNRDRIARQRRIYALSLGLMVAAAAALTLGLVRLMRTITTSLQALQQGTEVIGGGNLAHRIGLVSQDELGHLAQAFDLMTENLQATTVSRDELAREVAERRRAEEQVTALNDELGRNLAQLQTANRELEAFSYSVSHDLRAPLRHLTGFAELLRKRAAADFDEKGRHYLDVISAAAVQMGKLVDDLLAFSRAGRVELKREQVDFGELVKAVIEDFQREAEGRQVSWEVAGLPAVEGDAGLLRLVWVNLISNALKFTRLEERALIRIGGTDGGMEHVFHVKDNGVGFDMRYGQKLFGLFQRLHRPEEFEGTGVGLANVQRIVHRHGGRVWAEGAAGEGAAFFFSLPKRRQTR